jgi:hypothetical protein
MQPANFFALIFILILFGGCAALPPDPEPAPIYEESAPELSEFDFNSERYVAINVRYATNRIKNEKGFFLPEINLSDDPLSYGQEVVLIPFDRERGSFKDSHSALYKVWMMIGLKDEADDEIITIAPGQSLALTETEFFKGFMSTNTFGKGDILLFVHGFNVKFESSIKRAAQISYDIGLNLQPVVFSWPSIGEPLKYERDFGRALDSERDFRKFVSDLVASANGKKIHVLAHSMGSKVVIPALAKLYSENPKKFDKGLGNIILAAPDYPRETFLRDYKKIFSSFGRTTIYMSSEDKALQLSSGTYLADRDMLGFSGGNGFFYPGIDSIDITGIDSIDDILGHSKFGSSSRVLGDMHYMIGGGLRASKRYGFKVVPPNKYWTLQP